MMTNSQKLRLEQQPVMIYILLLFMAIIREIVKIKILMTQMTKRRFANQYILSLNKLSIQLYRFDIKVMQNKKQADHEQIKANSEILSINILPMTKNIRKKSARFLQIEGDQQKIITTQSMRLAPQKSQKNDYVLSYNRISSKTGQKSISMELPGKEQHQFKKVLILYTSGAAGANQNVQIVRGFLKSKIAQNQYLSDYSMQQNLQDRSFLVTPVQQNGSRVLYKVQQFNNIALSINVTLQMIKQIAVTIQQNYKKYDAFIILCGLDAICYISTIISFMLQNLSKLVIFTGGYFPISYMRNDTVNNLIESFAIISLADNFNDVIIVSKNKGYRANRTIKMREGELNSVSSPNIDALVSVNIKIKFREHLFLPTPLEEFKIWTEFTHRVGVVKLQILMSKQALEYQLSNPAYQGIVIETYASNNLPDNLQILNLFKRIAQQKGKFFITVAQSVLKVNDSIKKQYLEQFHIYFGGDMTSEAAIAKLSYLLSKRYSRNEIRKLIHTNMRGELTQIKNDNQFSHKDESFMEIVSKSIKQFYPTSLLGSFVGKIQDQICNYIVKSSCPKEIQQLFKKTQIDQTSSLQIYQKTVVELVDRNHLLHKSVRNSNENLYKYFLNFNVNVNILDQYECSPLFYGVSLKDKKAILYLSKKGGCVICPSDQLFQMIVKELKTDNLSFFQLLYHIEFKETLRQQTNNEGRNTLHLCAILGAEKCLKYILEKFKFNVKCKDSYGKMYIDYLRNS